MPGYVGCARGGPSGSGIDGEDSIAWSGVFEEPGSFWDMSFGCTTDCAKVEYRDRPLRPLGLNVDRRPLSESQGVEGKGGYIWG